MANYHSIVRNWGKAESTFDTQLAMGALEYKQGKYDANSAKIQEALNNYGNIGLLRDTEKKKLYDNLSNMVGTIEGVNGLDLSSNRVTNMIMTDISKTLDEDLVRHYSLFKNKARFDEEVEKKRADGKGKYSEINEAHAKHRSGFQQYMNGEAESFAPLKYVDHADLGEANQRLQKELSPYINTITKKTIEGEILYHTKESKELTRQRIIDFANATLTEEEKQQIAINGWAKYRGREPGALETDFLNYSNAENNQLELVISELKLDVASKNGVEKIKAEETLKEFKDALATNSGRYEQILNSGDVDSMTYALGANDFNNSISRAFAIDRNAVLKDMVAVIPGSLERALKEKDLDPKNLGSGIQVTTLAKEDEVDRDSYKEMVSEISEARDGYFRTTLDTFNTLDSSTQAEINKQIDNTLGPNATQEQKDDMKALKMIDLSQGNSSLLTEDQASNLEMSRFLYTSNKEKYEDIKKKVNKEYYTKTFQRLFNTESDIGNLHVVLNGEVVSVEKEMARRGINSLDSLLEEGNRELRAAISAEIELTNRTGPAVNAVRETFRAAPAFFKVAFEAIKNSLNFTQWYEMNKAIVPNAVKSEDLEKSFETMENLTEIYMNEGGMDKEAAVRAAETALELGEEGVSFLKEPVQGMRRRTDPKMEELDKRILLSADGELEADLQKYGVVKHSNIESKDFFNIRSMKRSGSSYEEAFRKELNKDPELMGRQQAISIAPGAGVAYTETRDKARLVGGLDVIKDDAIDIIELPNGEVELRAQVRIKGELESRSFRMLKRDLPTSVTNLINFSRGENAFTKQTFPEDISGESVYTNDPTVVRGKSNLFHNGTTEGDDITELQISPETVGKEMGDIAERNRQNLEEMGEKIGEPNMYERVVALNSKIINNLGRPLKVGVVKIDDRFRGTTINTKVYYEINGIEYKVFQDTTSIGEEELTNTWNEVKYKPQVYVSAMMRRIASGNMGMEEFKMLEEYYNN